MYPKGRRTGAELYKSSCFQGAFVKTATLEEAEQIYTGSISEPTKPLFEKLDLKHLIVADAQRLCHLLSTQRHPTRSVLLLVSTGVYVSLSVPLDSR